MAYTMNIRGRRIYLALMASSEAGDYIVYEWNDGVFIPSDDDNYPDLDYDDEDDDDESADDIYDFEFSDDEAEDEGEKLFEEDDDTLEEDEDDDDEDEDEVETAVREDIEAILSDGFIPQGGVSAVITPEYTTCYTQAFYRKK